MQLNHSSVNAAIKVAHYQHRHQNYDIFPYSYHIDMVMELADNYAFTFEWKCGAALHDVVEDGCLSISKVKKFFGEPVSFIVACVTDPIDLPNRKLKKEQVYRKLNGATDSGNCGPLAVKLIDRIANMEHSLKYGGSQIDMYRKEFGEFRTSLYRSEYKDNNVIAVNYLMQQLWSRLDQLLTLN